MAGRFREEVAQVRRGSWCIFERMNLFHHRWRDFLNEHLQSVPCRVTGYNRFNGYVATVLMQLTAQFPSIETFIKKVSKIPPDLIPWLHWFLSMWWQICFECSRRPRHRDIYSIRPSRWQHNHCRHEEKEQDSAVFCCSAMRPLTTPDVSTKITYLASSD